MISTCGPHTAGLIVWASILACGPPTAGQITPAPGVADPAPKPQNKNNVPKASLPRWRLYARPLSNHWASGSSNLEALPAAGAECTEAGKLVPMRLRAFVAMNRISFAPLHVKVQIFSETAAP